MKFAKKMAVATISTGLVLGTFGIAAPAFAHGYVDGPKSRALLCKEGVNTGCGSVAFEPQSLEYLKGFPAAGPADGKIASANGQFGGLLDAQSTTRWAKTDVTTGPLLIDWTYTAPHSTAGWSYYMTKTGWDQNAPLTRSELELVGTVTHDGSKAITNPDHVIEVPADRSGYHVILAVWDIADTVNAFYNVIDVNVTGEGEIDAAPAAPTKVTATEKKVGSVDLAWSNSGESIKYSILRDGVEIGKSTTPAFTDVEVVPGAKYKYSVIAINSQGTRSAASASVNFTVSNSPGSDKIAPTAPSKLHTMKVTENTVNLMWGKSFDASGDPKYQVFKNGYLVATTGMTMWNDTSVQAGTTYSYSVKAIDAAGNTSGASNVLSVTTTSAPTPTPTPTPVDSGTWNSKGAYAAGDTVTFNGTTYRAVQSHQGVGDPNWINALSLWAPVNGIAPAPEVTPAPSAGAWDVKGSYSAGDRVSFGGSNYEAVQSHTGNGDPNWIYAGSLWKKV